MDSDREKSDRFSRDLESMISGKKRQAKAEIELEYEADIAFTEKVLETRAVPSPVFQAGLKQNLMSKLAAAEERGGAEKLSVTEWLQNLFSRRVWQLSGATAIIVIGLFVAWRVGLFSSEEGSVVTTPYPTVAVEARVALSADSYIPGQTVLVEFTFENKTSQTMRFSFPPAFRIETISSETAKAFSPGTAERSLSPGESASHNVSWDQKDSAGNQVNPGEYQVVLPNVSLGEAGFLSLPESPSIIIVGQ